MRFNYGGYKFQFDTRPKPPDKKKFHHRDISDLTDRLMAALTEVGVTKDDFEGHKFHGNQWTGGIGGGPKPDTVKTKGVKSNVHELLSSGHHFSLAELAKITGATEVALKQALAMLQNPKWAGSQGTLTIEKTATGYQIKRSEAPKEEPKPTPPPVAAPVPSPSPAPAPAPVAAPAPAPKPKPVEKPIEKFSRSIPAAKRFATAAPEDIHQHLKEKFGLGFDNGQETGKDYAALRKDYWGNTVGKTPEEASEYKKKLSDAQSKHYANPFGNTKGHIPIDITKSGSAAKAQRQMVGVLDDALSELDKTFDVKAALSRGNVQMTSGSPTKSLGHAIQMRMPTAGVGHYASEGKGDKMGTVAFKHGVLLDMKDQMANAKTRKAQGKPLWTVSNETDELADHQRAIIVHELAHAIGMQPHINSPAKLLKILEGLFPVVPAVPSYKLAPWKPGQDTRSERTKWIEKNLSTYATTNIKETDAELAAKVTSRHYVRGTLPKVLEDHVDELFQRRKHVVHSEEQALSAH